MGVIYDPQLKEDVSITQWVAMEVNRLSNGSDYGSCDEKLLGRISMFWEPGRLNAPVPFFENSIPYCSVFKYWDKERRNQCA